MSSIAEPVLETPRKLLVVDDERGILSSIEDLLEDDFRVLATTDGREALDILKHERDDVSVILSDQRMPGMNGDEFLARAKKLSRAIRVLFTGYADIEALVRAVNEGHIFGYVAKPWDPNELKNLVSKAADHFELLKAVQESEERLRRVFLSAPIGMCVFPSEGPLQQVNKKLVNMLGYDDEELRQRSLERLVHPGDRDQVEQAVRELFDRKRESVRKEVRFNDKDGALLWTELTGTLIYDELALGMVENVTERRNAENAREHLVRILEATPDFVNICDAEGKCLYLNRAARDLLGLEPDTPLANVAVESSYLAKECERLKLEAFPSALERGSWSGEVAMRRHDGSEIQTLHVVLTHESPDGSTVFSTIARDVTELKALELQARHAQKMEAIGNLAGGVAHDFNNLLTAIICYAQMAHKTRPDDDPERDDLEEILKAAELASAVTQQLLTFSRRQVVQPRVLHLREIVDNLVLMLERLIGETIELTVHHRGGLDRVRADAGHVEQILMNLVVNARDAMPDGGKLLVETAEVELDEAFVRSHSGAEPGSHVEIVVRDTGCGMNDEIKSHIFEPFFTTKEEGKGTGLGLATVYGIVRQHGGLATVESELGRGTTFRLYLPIIEELAESETQVESADIAWPERSQTVLLVEDDAAVRDVVRRVLEQKGCRVLAAPDGAEAIRLLDDPASSVDLLLTDIVLPGMDGFALAERFRQSDATRPVILLSGYVDRVGERVGKLPPETVFLPKPFNAATLANTVREALDRSSS